MSINNDWAWRTPIDNLNKFTAAFKLEAEQQLKLSIEYWLKQIWGNKTIGFKQSWYKAEKFASKYHQILSKVSPGFRFWIRDGYAYIIPQGITAMFLVEGAEDWGYQDQVDEPDPIPNNWQQRGEI